MTSEKMLKLAKASMLNSYSPYSNFMVGCCILSTNGNFYSSTNVENASYPVGICAEGGAISTMIANGDTEIKEILVMGKSRHATERSNNLVSPCGLCRQRINEFSNVNTIVHIANENEVLKTLKMSELLPYAFGPNNLVV